MKDKVRIFVGASANGEDAVAEMAYEYSLRKNSDREIEIVWMRQSNDPENFWYGFNCKLWGTPFSGFRWAIPEYCDFEGRAIYTDSDMLNNCDIGELFDLPMNGKWMLARKSKRFGREYCVMLMDCTKFRNINNSWKQDKHGHGRLYQWFTKNCDKYVGDLDPAWNSLDGDIKPFKQLHFTNMLTQPWKPSWFDGVHEPHADKELEQLFWDTVQDARKEGYSIDDYDPRTKPGYTPVKYKVLRGYY